MHQDPIRNTGGSLLIVGVATSSWTEVTALGQPISDILLLAGTCLLYLHHSTIRALRRPTSLNALPNFLPVSGALLVTAALVATWLHGTPMAGVLAAIRMAIVLVAVPGAVLLYIRNTHDAERLLISLVIGTAANSAVAISDQLAGTAIGPATSTWTEYPSIAAQRAVGLTGHPNLLGYACAVTLVLAFGKLLTVGPRHAKLLHGVALITISAGLVLSASRGAALAASLGAIYWSIKARRGRYVLLLVSVSSALLLVLSEQTIDSPISRLLGQSGGVGQSNAARVNDLQESLALAAAKFPTGAGFEYLPLVHSTPVAVIAAGGVLAALALLIWTTGMIRAARLARGSEDPLTREISDRGAAASVAAATYLLFSPMIYHRYAVIPIAVVLALAAQEEFRRQHNATPCSARIARRVPTRSAAR